MSTSKANPSPGWPPAEGCYLRGNETSPVAVVVILRSLTGEAPPEIDRLVSVAAVGGAAIAGTLQTENIGLEKVVCNVVSNPNIRYLVLCATESPGHMPGSALRSLLRNGVDETGRIIGAESCNPFLYNLPPEYVARFREQITLIDMVGEESPERLEAAVAACCGTEPAPFNGQELHDPGAFPSSPLSGRIEWGIIEVE